MTQHSESDQAATLPAATDPTEEIAAFRAAIAGIAATALKMRPEQLDPRENMSRYGVDSIIVTEIMKRISDFVGQPVAPTVFFEARHMQDLADILHQRIGSRPGQRATIGPVVAAKAEISPVGKSSARPASATLQPVHQAEPRNHDAAKHWLARFQDIANQAAGAAPLATQMPASATPAYRPVAIIAMAGSFAGSADIEALEANLRHGVDCISEVPPERWDWRKVYGDPRQGEFTRVKFGGFAPDIDKFDPAFFGISPREAALMDPQHRRFMQCTWHLIEQAGYAPRGLSGRKIGIFLGINLQDYALKVSRQGAMEAAHLTSHGHMFCPNRLSFLLDVHGPSQVIDTACSSSLVALHRAALSVQHEECEMAIAGGANLLITPDMHVMYSKVGMTCEDGRCKTFSRHANGYARGDGIGAVLLKPLAQAERDGDTILAVIRGSAENHGGQSTSLTAPNPRAQADLIIEAHRRAGIDPRSIGYIECHGTGTALGDPIEINGLKSAFAALHAAGGIAAPTAPYCGLGSIKSNIGHAETAAGIAGLIKAVLSLQQGWRYPTLHCEEINPMIDLAGSPFFITQQGGAWPRPLIDGKEQPRRAGISSFGAGGSNAHVVIEEYFAPSPVMMMPVLGLSVFPLSARSDAQLRQQAENLAAFIASAAAAQLDLSDIAYTLQVGRDALAHRLVLFAASAAELVQGIAAYLDGRPDAGWRQAVVKRGQQPAASPGGRDVVALAEAWLHGAEIHWLDLHETGRRRVKLPTYPFARQSHWIGEFVAVADSAAAHPMVQQRDDPPEGMGFNSHFEGSEPFLADHVVMGRRLLPGVAYLEMALEIAARSGSSFAGLRNVVWAQPCAVAETGATLRITLSDEKTGRRQYRVFSRADGGEILHSQGAVLPADQQVQPVKLDLAALQRELPIRLAAETCYEAFRHMGIHYGPTHQCIQHVQHSALGAAAPAALALLQLAAGEQDTARRYRLHPGLIDSALQACIGLMAAAGFSLLPGVQDTLPAALPFALDEMNFLAPIPNRVWAWIRPCAGSQANSRLQKLDIDLCDDDGQVCLRLHGFTSRVPEMAATAPVADTTAQATLITMPAWHPVSRPADTAPAAMRRVLLLLDAQGALPAGLQAALAVALPAADIHHLPLSGALADCYGAAVLATHDLLQREITRSETNPVLFQVVIPEAGEGDEASMLFGLTGMLRTAMRESRRLVTQLCGFSANHEAMQAAAILRDEAGDEPQLRFRAGLREAWHWQPATSLPQDIGTQHVWRENGVYLITGGAGGLGQLLVGHIAKQAGRAKVILWGRSAAPARPVIISGASVHYCQVDVTDAVAVRQGIAEILARHGRLDGVLHCAGLVRDSFIAAKKPEDIPLVLAPKVAGSINLDAATQDIDLDFLLLFASAAGAWGSAGQADYAAANAFMDAFAQRRAALVRQGRRKGLSVAIDWPFWQDGGIRMERHALAMMRQSTGLQALPSAAGLAALDDILAAGLVQAAVLHGDPERVRQSLKPIRDDRPVAPPPGQARLAPAIEALLCDVVADQMQFALADIEPEAEWRDFGYDSISFTELANRLNGQHDLDLTPTVFFEFPSIAALAAWLAAQHANRFGKLVAASQSASQPIAASTQAAVHAPAVETLNREPAIDNAVAIIGMSGRFPMADDLNAFWENLQAGRDCIGEIPPERWDWRAAAAEAGITHEATGLRWGGFINGIDQFDARFFGISPREALRMDPQQRLLMLYAWKAIEDAGYAPGSLAGSNLGLFIATAPSGYANRTVQGRDEIDAYSSTGAVGSVGPNRMSYFLNVHGPSEPIETACSSALVALHRALAAMAQGDCDTAIVGGINLIVDPDTQISFDRAGMLSPDGRCKTFSRQANGYGRGEGIGMLYLKKLSAAERDGDRILAVIRGSGENHGGRANSLTAPNPRAQAELIKQVWRRAGIDPRSIGYIEAHGTGTALGDPIEADALKTAFREFRPEDTAPLPYCGLGAVKTNIGHLELAAGIAGMIKTVLQLQHRRLVPSLHCTEVNPHIQLQDTPLYLVRENQSWPAPLDAAGQPLPRRAGVSSFGFGGVNAHVVLEEYVPATDHRKAGPDKPLVVVLSAKNGEALKAYAQALLNFITVAPALPDGEADACQAAKLRAIMAGILDVAPADIDLETALADIGVDALQRTLLHGRLQAAGIAPPPLAVILKAQSLSEIARELWPEEAVRNVAALASVDLAALAYTLQVGRDAMSERLAFIAASLAEMQARLQLYLADPTRPAEGIHIGRQQDNRSMLAAFRADEQMQQILDGWLSQGKLTQLLELWSKGVEVDWRKLYGPGCFYPAIPQRISAPGYPFAAQRYWIDPAGLSSGTAAKAPVPQQLLHPIVHQQDADTGCYSTDLTGAEFFLADHKLHGQPILPGVAYLEMARFAASHYRKAHARGSGEILCLHNFVWLLPVIVDQPRRLWIELTSDGGRELRCEIANARDGAAEMANRQVHGQGRVSWQSLTAPAPLEPSALLEQAGWQKKAVADIYGQFRQVGLDYGPSHRGLHGVYARPDEVLAHLVLPEAAKDDFAAYGLHPGLLDSALQAAIGFGLAAENAAADGEQKLFLPFAIERLEFFGATMPRMWAWLRQRPIAQQRLRKLDIDLCDEAGRLLIRIVGFTARVFDAKDAAPVQKPMVEVMPADDSVLRRDVTAYLRQILATCLEMPLEDIHADEALDGLGIDSIMVMELTRRLEAHFGELPKTLFFEFQTLADLAQHFVSDYRAQVQALSGVAAHVDPASDAEAAPNAVASGPIRYDRLPAMPGGGPLDIAIVGLSGRYPEAVDIEAYWRNLRDGRDCIIEVPPERWDWRAYYSADRGEAERHYCKWGGFIADVDKFDPLFFSISPSTAEYIDPQERLFLEHAWMAIEDAGYTRASLQQAAAGQLDGEAGGQVGVYAGVMYGEYQMLALEASLQGKTLPVINFYASIANRVSYALNLQGPSLAVDTMCSSSLTAIHLACQDLKTGRIGMALAGGVNLNLHPNKYGMLSRGQFISSTGRCESFGADGDGYVPSEGVGVVVLKRLADAIRDGDQIYGVIKGSALNHGGRTSGYSVPNPKAQHMVISRALAEAGIDPATLSYIEAHGTGTKLGDPIEISGLARAIGDQLPPGQICAIGSSKSNIGHAEGASGIAGLTKVLLQMREGVIAPSLHSRSLNPNINFDATPFRVNQALMPWPRANSSGREAPRVAGLSSFGAGGANAHLIVAEHIAEARPVAATIPALIPLSARSSWQLRQQAENLLQYLQSGKPAALRDIAFTLQVGREAMQHRLCFVANSLDDLAEKLRRFLANELADLSVGRVVAVVDQAAMPSGRALDAVAAFWVRGGVVEWAEFHGAGEVLRRVSLPTYPFERTRYWIELPDRPDSRPAPRSDPGSDPGPQRAEPVLGMVLGAPRWVASDVAAASPKAAVMRHVIGIGIDPPQGERLHASRQHAGGAFEDYALALLARLKVLLRQPGKGPLLLQIVIAPGDRHCPAALCSALAGLLKTAQMETPRLSAQLIELDAQAAMMPTLATLLDAEAGQAATPHIRYRQGRRELPVWQEIKPTQATPPWRQGGHYLITGGAGGLGILFAEEIVSCLRDVRLTLTGRSPLKAAQQQAIDQLCALGAKVVYLQADITDAASVRRLMDALAPQPLNGVIHAAGLLRDGLLLRKSAEDFSAVLAPKVAGLINLDLATRRFDLDFFALFSSVSGALGNPGQCDYATANAFMDRYAAYRNELAVAGGPDAPHGHMVSINWPLWQSGGMDIDDAAKAALWQKAGLIPLRPADGLIAFDQAMASGESQVLVLQGDAGRLQQHFVKPDHGMAPPPSPPKLAAAAEDHNAAAARVITDTLAGLLKLPAHRIEADVPLEEYGVDSVVIMKLTGELEKQFGALSQTLFFEYPTISSAAAYLSELFPEQLAPLAQLVAAPVMPMPQAAPGLAAKPKTATEEEVVVTPVQPSQAGIGVRDIAIIGMAGRFPMAPDIATFWRNLVTAQDCITEVPPERWDHGRYFAADPGVSGKTNCKWGGFIDGVDMFDHRFFRISPGEAELLDPQERLFLETAWTLLESAGYLGEIRKRRSEGRIGVFVGSMSQQYHAFRADLSREAVLALTSQSSIANRVSYFFNLKGPSIAIDTMCSSGLVALDMACDSLRKGDCRAAIVGGVNLSIHPKKYVGLSIGQMIGSHADSRSFSDGDGYLPAEAVAAVLLKPLHVAIADGDDIMAVIKGSHTNHSGQASGYRVPNVAAQAELIAENFTRAGIDPRTISYVEAAANGSAMADAIEMRALCNAFEGFTKDRQFCAIGAVKSNIGHAEAASGLSQLIKVVLQMRHRQLVPTLVPAPLNPGISFENSPFYLQRQAEAWHQPVLALDGAAPRSYPRRATISAFGAGGSNAHVILEEYEAPNIAQVPRSNQKAPLLFPLSARTPEQLQLSVRRLLDFLEQRPTIALDQLAYTLQLAREAMDYRLALVADNLAALRDGLRGWLDDAGFESQAVYCIGGNAQDDNGDIRLLLAGETGKAMLDLLLQSRDLKKLALYWVRGARIAWFALHDKPEGQPLLALPAYPFERQRFWLSLGENAEAVAMPQSAAAVSGFVHDPARSQHENMLLFLRMTVAQGLGLPLAQVAPAAGFLDLGCGSIQQLQLRQDFERQFGIALSARDCLEHDSLMDLARHAAGRIAAEPADKPADSEITPPHWPLSEGQKALWLAQKLRPALSAYNVPVALRLAGPFDAAALQRAGQWLLQQFPILASRFEQQADDIRQSPGIWAFSFTEEPAEMPQISTRLRLLGKVPFDLAQVAPFRLHVITSPAAHDLLLVFHHIVADGRSAALVSQALVQAYQAFRTGEAPAPMPAAASYGAYVTWQRDVMQRERGQAQLGYWRRQLADLPMARHLPMDFARDAIAGLHGASQQCDLPVNIGRLAQDFARAHKISAATLFLGVFMLLLHRYRGDTDIIVGMPVLGRPEPAYEMSVGHFVNLVLLRGRLQQGESSAAWLRRLQFALADALDNADCPFPVVQQALREDGVSLAPSVLFSYQNFLSSGQFGPLGDVEWRQDIAQEGGQDLALEVYETEVGYRLRFDYDDSLMRPATVARMAAHFCLLLEKLLALPDLPITTHDYLAASEQAQLLHWGRGAELPPAMQDDDIVACIRAQAQRAPEHAAVQCAGQHLSYAELDRDSDRLAQHLLRQGVAQGSLVGMCMGRDAAAIVALLAIWKIGAVYVPMALEDPPERLRHMVSDSGMACVIADKAARAKLADMVSGSGLRLMAIEELAGPVEAGISSPVYVRPADRQAAYVIYTSGSTGLPKGVEIAHGAVRHHVRMMAAALDLAPADHVLQFASLAVDVALEQILSALSIGATLVMRPDAQWSATEFRQVIAGGGVTVADIPPVYLHAVLMDTAECGDWSALLGLRLVIVGGEALTPETLALWRASPLRDCRLLNAYGPTETTITSLICDLSAHDAMPASGLIPIGRPLPGETALILDDAGKLAPVGVVGELLIGGAGLALGYRNRPDLTRERFVPHPLQPATLLYRTGDLACWLDDGRIAFQGRRDEQVKIRGHRIECGEVESLLRGQAGIRQVAVLARRVLGEDRLIAFVVPAPALPSDAEAVWRQGVMRAAPAYMVPAQFVLLETMPLTASGKVDRQALLRFDLPQPAARPIVPPEGEDEQRLAGIWRDLLGVAEIGRQDDFFALGGHSLLALRLAGRIRAEFGCELSLAALLAAPDILRQARLLRQVAPGVGEMLVCLRREGEQLPLFLVHGGTGDALSYRELVRHLPAGRPVYALQAPALLPQSLAELAQHYLAAIRRVQPQGPYRLAGWSMGGVIAHAMACQLRQAGEAVAGLALIDSYTPEALRQLTAVSPGLTTGDTVLRRIFADGNNALPLAANETRQLQEAMQALGDLLDRHQPTAYAGDVLLIAASEGRLDQVWPRLVDGALRVVTQQGDHYSLMQLPQAQAVAATLGEYLR